jgi:O-antigen/teichoic acid export membrane protein
MAAVPQVPLPEEIRKRMLSFSGLGAGLMLLQIVLWDRSDIIFLKLLQPDIRQLAYFSVCFSIVDRLTLPAQALADALSATQMAEYGRDKKNLFKMTSHAFVYVFMGTLPILIGIACIGGPFIRTIYGPQYLPAIPVFILMALLSIPKALLTPARSVLYATEELGFILTWGCVAGLINIVLDVLLIPGHGAIGAALGNGIAQTFAVLALAWHVLASYPVRISTAPMLRLGAATLAMAIVVVALVVTPISGALKLTLAIPGGAIVFAIVARISMMLQNHDRQRLLTLSNLVPSSARPSYERLVNFLVPASVVGEFSR